MPFALSASWSCTEWMMLTCTTLESVPGRLPREAEAPLMLLCSMSIWKGLVMVCLHPYPMLGLSFLTARGRAAPAKPVQSSCSED